MGYVVPELASYPSCPETRHLLSLVCNFHPPCVEDRSIPSRYRDLPRGNPLFPLCPVKALRALFDRYPAPPHAPLFTRLFQQPFTKTFFVRSMQLLLLNAGIPMFGYSGHSLRKGAAVTADRNGISRHHIKLLGRWERNQSTFISTNADIQNASTGSSTSTRKSSLHSFTKLSGLDGHALTPFITYPCRNTHPSFGPLETCREIFSPSYHHPVI